MLIGESLSLNNLSDLTELIKEILKYTVFFELMGTLLLALHFVPLYGFEIGLFRALFSAISLFCNAGLDIVPGSSFSFFQTDVVVNFVLVGLIIIGGLGFLVWHDFGIKYKLARKNRISVKKFFQSLELHTKIVFCVTLFLLLFGTLGILGFEYSNPETIGELSFGNKLLVSFFQSATFRTAGASTIEMGAMTMPSKMLGMALMFIGGSPASMAGGIKTVTFFVILLLIVSTLRGKQTVEIFHREISQSTINKAVTVFFIGLALVASATMLLSVTETPRFIERTEQVELSHYPSTSDIIFETVSAYATVGLSTGITPTLSYMGKVVIMLLMFIGRVGSITVALAVFSRERGKHTDNIRYPEGRIVVG